MNENNNSDLEYFLQTRREIDTEKQQRDSILNFAVLVLGAIAFAIIQSEKLDYFLTNKWFISIEISGLLIITSLFYIRRKKLQQIYDRWFVLDKLAVKLFNDEYNQLLESIVIKDIKTYRYITKDIVLNFTLSSPLYIMIFNTAIFSLSCNFYKYIMPIIIIVLHIVFSLVVIIRKAKDPFVIANK